MINITFLGTSAMVPTKERNVSGLFLKYKSEGILFDCGEGSQRQMNIAGIKRTSVTKILISHWHGDHIAGIVGLLQTMGNKENNPKIEIFGPKGTKEHMKHLLKMCIFDVQIDLKVHELNPKGVETFYETDDFLLQCASLEHNVPVVGYSFIEKDKRRIDKAYLQKMKIGEGPHLKKLQAGKSIVYKGKKIDVKKATYVVKGKKFTYFGDTSPCTNAVKLAENSDILVSESSYSSKLQEKAEEYKHMTAKDAALLANQANVKTLYLTHFSQRYKTTEEIEEDAKTYFENTICAYDFLKIKL